MLQERDTEKRKQKMELRLKVVELEGSESQTEEENKKKFKAEFTNVNDKILCREEIIKKCKDAESERAKRKSSQKGCKKKRRLCSRCAKILRGSAQECKEGSVKAISNKVQCHVCQKKRLRIFARIRMQRWKFSCAALRFSTSSRVIEQYRSQRQRSDHRTGA